MRQLKTLLLALLFFVDVMPKALPAQTIIGNLPFTLQNGTIADANQVMADFNTIVAAVNANAANAGANSNITALNGLTTPLVYTSGGSSNYIGGTSSGAANAQIIASPIPAGFTLIAGKSVTFIAGFTNTGPTQLNVAGTGLINVFRQGTAGPVSLSGGEITIGNVVTAIYDGTEYQIASASPQSLVPACTVIDYNGANGAPSGYLLMNGQTPLRASFPTLFACIAVQGVAATTTNSSNSVVVPNSNLFQIGWFVGGNNVTCNSTITAIPDGTHITISNNAGAGGATTLTIGPYSQGDCSTTFAVGNFLGRTTIMRDTGGTVLTSTTCTNPASIGSNCGGQTETLTLLQTPGGLTVSGTVTVNPNGSSSNFFPSSPGSNFTSINITTSGSTAVVGTSNATLNNFNSMSGANTLTSSNTGAAGNGSGAAAAHPILGPVALVDKYIKF